MNQYKRTRYANLIKPLSLIIDLGIIIFSLFLFQINITDFRLLVLYISVIWLIISFRNDFYEIKRNTIAVRIATLLIKQFIVYALTLYAFIGIFKQPDISRLALAYYLLFIFLIISFFKYFTYFLLNRYRAYLKGNTRQVIVIGENEKTKQLIQIFNSRLDFGYIFKKQFKVDVDFSLETCFEYVTKNKIDEIYFSVSELTDLQIDALINFADNNLRELKFIPDNKRIFSKKLKYEYYDYIPILSLRNIPLQEPVNQVLKRAFDIISSIFVIVFILSWLTPILALFIILESKGPVFFKQLRNGINNEEFACYKFRSMKKHSSNNTKQTVKDDMRVTRVGKFIRKTSIDELPQFFNVLFGDMSVVGPRPHMISHNDEFSKKIDKFMVRHFIKPGITGLAQISGFRGEIETDKDMVNRVKYDIFYIENWSIILDVKIMIQTVLNAIKGDEKAY